ncbi:uncharacterized protein L203_103572 [Cryptococcus depauperatus CBS 7841]|uniref:Uncharacterized protein n=1 Tax=Cryptococcus depauperatus CBS 7841 TaxID=1295531 RepID=A0A1E3II01_9TREE|nr:hypothetical protein L203_02831 [Cryptococcus depauperatus CBS 7841]
MNHSATTTRPTQDENNAIQSALAIRRRHSLTSILRDFRQAKKSQNARPAAVEELATPEEDSDIEGLQTTMDDPIKLVSQWTRDAGGQEVNLDQLGNDLEPQYVWDVLFENQRGIYILGAAYYSSRTLLPADPSAFSRPNRPIPSGSSFSLRDPSFNPPVQPVSNPSNGRSQPKSSQPAQSNKTSYTLESFHPPSPRWEYLTPWMVNMRNGTDEVGWRYNGWFRKNGWRSHAGNLGWFGWVRRREWIRLRRIKAGPVEELACVHDQSAAPILPGQKAGREKKEGHERSEWPRLNEMLTGDTEENVSNILKEMGRCRLDRQRLEFWEKWLADLEKGSLFWQKLEAIVLDQEAVSFVLLLSH